MVTMSDIQALVNRIVESFHPERIILFGSYAYGTPSPYSDVDLLVILPFEGKNFRQSMRIINTVNPPFSADVLARRPDDTRWRYEQGDPLIREALDKGKVLYEQSR
jgi:predicted nucleotidyltransferase